MFSDVFQVLKATCLQIGFVISGIQNRTNTFCVAAGLPSKLNITRQPPTVILSGVYMTPGPLISVLDNWGNIATGQSTVTLQLIIPSSNKQSNISKINLTTVTRASTAGTLNYTDIAIYVASGGYQLSFRLDNGFSISSKSFDVIAGDPVSVNITSQPGLIWHGQRTVVAGIMFRVEASLFDTFGNTIVCCCQAQMSINYFQCVNSSSPNFVLNASNNIISSSLQITKLPNVTNRGVMVWDILIKKAQLSVSFTLLCEGSCPFKYTMQATTEKFNVIHGSQKNLVILTRENYPITQIFQNISSQGVVAGTAVFFDVELEDGFGNRVHNSTKIVPYIDFSSTPSVVSSTNSNPEARLLVTWAGAGCFSSSKGTLLVCNSPLGCGDIDSGIFNPVAGSIVGTDCPAMASPVALSDGMARIPFHIDLACIAKLQVCLASGVLESKHCPPNGSESAANCAFNLPSCQIFAVSDAFEILPDAISQVLVTYCSSNNSSPLPVGGELVCSFTFSDQYGNPVVGEIGTKQWQVSARYGGNTIKGFPTVSRSLNGTLDVIVPRESSTFTSPFSKVVSHQEVSYSFDAVPPPQQDPLTAKSFFFDIVHGPAAVLAFTSSIQNTEANSLIQMTGSNGSNIFLTVQDSLGNLDENFNQAIRCNIEANVDLRSPGWLVFNGSWVGNLTALNGLIVLPPLWAKTKVESSTALFLHIVLTNYISIYSKSQAFQISSGPPYLLHVISSPTESVSYEPLSGLASVTILDEYGNWFSCRISVSARLESCPDIYCDYPEVLTQNFLVGSSEVIYDPFLLSANFTDLSVQTVSPARFRLRFDVCAPKSLSTTQCLHSNVEVYASCSNISVQTITIVSDSFYVSVVQNLILLSQPGTDQGIDPNISPLPRVLSGASLGPLVVHLIDYAGNLVNNSVASVTVSIGGLPTSTTLLGTTVMVSKHGSATFSGLSFAGFGGGVQLIFTLSTNRNIRTSSRSFNVEAKNAIHLRIDSQPHNSVTAGAVFSVILSLLNFYMNQTENIGTELFAVAAIWDNPSSGSILFGPSTKNFPQQISCEVINGTASFTTLEIQKVSLYQLAFYVPSSHGYLEGPDTVVSQVFSVVHGQVSQLQIVNQPGSMGVARPMSVQPVLQLADQYLNVIRDQTVSDASTVTAGLSGPQGSLLGGTTTVTAVLGLITFTDLIVDGTGDLVSESYTLIFHLYVDKVLVGVPLNSENFAVRSFQKLTFGINPYTKSSTFALVTLEATVLAEDAEGRLVPSKYEVLVSSSLPLFSGTLEQNTTLGIALFDNLVFNLSKLQNQKIELNFSCSESPTVPVLSSGYFSVAPGPFYEFSLVVQPPSDILQKVAFDHWSAPCPSPELQRQSSKGRFSGCGPVVILRDATGHLEQTGSVQATLLQCRECVDVSSCTCKDVTSSWSPLSCGSSGPSCVPCSPITIPGYAAFPALQIDEPFVDLFIQFRRYADEKCTSDFVGDSAAAVVISASFNVYSSTYFRVEIDYSKCPPPGAVYISGQSLFPIPKVLGVYDVDDNPSFTAGNVVKALVYRSDDGMGALGCSDSSDAAGGDCFEYNGYELSHYIIPFTFTVNQSTAEFFNLSIFSSSFPNSFSLRFYTHAPINCTSLSMCSFTGNIVYADCPYGFYVMNSAIARIDILVQPIDSVAGSDLSTVVAALLDSFGNVVVNDSSTLVEVTVDIDREEANKSFNFRYFPFNASEFSSSIRPRLVQANSGLLMLNEYSNTSIRIIKAISGYFLHFSIVSSLSMTIESNTFEVIPCAFRTIEIFPSKIKVAAGDSICGSWGSAWQEIQQISKANASFTCVCTFEINPNYTAGASSPWNLSSSSGNIKCSLLCPTIYETRKNYFSNSVLGGKVQIRFSNMDMSGESETRPTSWQNSFYDGSQVFLQRRNFEGNIFLNSSVLMDACDWYAGCHQSALVLHYDNYTRQAQLIWELAYNAPKNSTLLIPATKDWYRIILTDQAVRTQEYRCVIALKDVFGNLLGNKTTVYATLYDPITGINALALEGTIAEQSIGGLVTFPNISAAIRGEYLLQFQVGTSHQVISPINTSNPAILINVTYPFCSTSACQDQCHVYYTRTTGATSMDQVFPSSRQAPCDAQDSSKSNHSEVLDKIILSASTTTILQSIAVNIPFDVSIFVFGSDGNVWTPESEIWLNLQFCTLPCCNASCEFQDMSFCTGVCSSGVFDGLPCTSENISLCQSSYRSHANPPCETSACGLKGVCATSKNAYVMNGSVLFKGVMLCETMADRKYRLLFSVPSQNSSVFNVTDSFSVSPSVFHHLAMLDQPFGAQAGIPLVGQPKVEQRDLYENIVTSAQQIQARTGNNITNSFFVKRYACSNQICNGDDNYFCPNALYQVLSSSDQDVVSECATMCQLDTSCIGFTFYAANMNCALDPVLGRRPRGAACSKSFPCYMAFYSCTRVADPVNEGTVYLIESLGGNRKVMSLNGVASFSDLALYNALPQTLVFCVLTIDSCADDLRSNSFTVIPGTLSSGDLNIIFPITKQGSVSDSIQGGENCTAELSLLDYYGNKISDLATVYLSLASINAASSFSAFHVYGSNMEMEDTRSSVILIEGGSQSIPFRIIGEGQFRIFARISVNNSLLRNGLNVSSNVFRVDPMASKLVVTPSTSLVYQYPNEFLSFEPEVVLLDSAGRQANLSSIVIVCSLLSVSNQLTSESDLIGVERVQARFGLAIFDQLGIKLRSTVTDTVAATILFQALTDDFSVSSATCSFSIQPPGATQLELTAQPITAIAGQVLQPNPVIQIMTPAAAAGTLDLAAQSRRPISASISARTNVNPFSSCEGPFLLGTTVIEASGGIATFTDLKIICEGYFTIQFSSSPGNGTVLISTVHVSVSAAEFNNVSLLTFGKNSSISNKAGQPLVKNYVLVAYDAYMNVDTTFSQVVEVSIGRNAPGILAQTHCWTYLSDYERPWSLEYPPPVCAQLVHPGNSQQRVGSDSVRASYGIAEMFCIAVDKVGSGYTLNFNLPFITIESDLFNIQPGQVAGIVVAVQPSFCTSCPRYVAGEYFHWKRTPTIAFADAYGNELNGDVKISNSYANVSILNQSQLICNALSCQPAHLKGVTVEAVANATASFPLVFIELAFRSFQLEFQVNTYTCSSVVFEVVHRPIVGMIKSIVEPGEGISNQPLSKQPVIQLFDDLGNAVIYISFEVQVRIIPLDSNQPNIDDISATCPTLVGTLSVSSSQSIVVFTDLKVAASSGLYMLEYSVIGILDSSQYHGFPVSINASEAREIIAFSAPFRISAEPAFLQIKPAANSVCESNTNKTLCEIRCIWRNEKCLGFQDAVAGDILTHDIQIEVIDARGTLVKVDQSYRIHAFLIQGVTGLKGSSLQRKLSGTTTVSVVNGLALFTDISINLYAQGIRMGFALEASEASLNVDQDINVSSSPFAVYGPVENLTVLRSPDNETIISADSSISSIVVELRDTMGSRAIYSSGDANITLVGQYLPRCPAEAKVLPMYRSDAQGFWNRYSDSNQLDQNSFLALLQSLIGIDAANLAYIELFQTFDRGGSTDSENLPAPDGFISYAEYQDAVLFCVCSVGFGVLNRQQQTCESLPPCPIGFIGLICRQTNAKESIVVEQISPVTGKTTVPVSLGLAVFSNLTVTTAGRSFQLNISSHGRWVLTPFFKVFPGTPRVPMILSPLPTTYVAGTPINIVVVVLDEQDNFNPLGTASVVIEHENISAFTSQCKNSSQILQCDSCPDNSCPGPTCPYRCDLSNTVRPKSGQDKSPTNKYCSYNCKKGCTFICGTMQGDTVDGILSLSDLQIKIAGQHSIRAVFSYVKSDSSMVMDWSSFYITQHQVINQIAAISNNGDKARVEITVRSSSPFFLVSEYESLPKAGVPAGTEIFPYPVCSVSDLYGNIVEDQIFRIGLIVRDSNRDEYDVGSATQKFSVDPLTYKNGVVQGWPPGSGFPLGDYIFADFTEEPSNVVQDDADGCPAVGAPNISGCPEKDDSPYSVSKRDQVVSYNWCPANEEMRYCRGCLTAERTFESFNATYWKQTYQFVNTSIPVGFLTSGAFDCPDRQICESDGTCACLILLRNSSLDPGPYDVCQACSSRAMPDGIPVSETVNGRAVFRGITCSKPRKGYRFVCVSPPGNQNRLLVQPLLHSVSFDLKAMRRPMISFQQDELWGPYDASIEPFWVDSSGNHHPNAETCSAVCVNSSESTGIEQDYRFASTCQSMCWRYGFPLYSNPLFSYVRVESPALSSTFVVVSGIVKRLLIKMPLGTSQVVQQDATYAELSPGNSILNRFTAYTADSSFLFDCPLTFSALSQCISQAPYFEVADIFNNPNRTSKGYASVSLVPGESNNGTIMTGILETNMDMGKAVFNFLRISCPGIGFNLDFSYQERLDIGPFVTGLSLPFQVLPQAPRVAGISFDASMTQILLILDRESDRGGMPILFDCNEIFYLFLRTSSKYGNMSNGTQNKSHFLMKTPFGNSPHCSWESPSTLIMTLGSNATVTEGYSLSLKNEPFSFHYSILVLSKNLVSPPSNLSVQNYIISGPLGIQEVPFTLCLYLQSQTDNCFDTITGEDVRDAITFQFGGILWIVVGSYCQWGNPVAAPCTDGHGLVLYRFHEQQEEIQLQTGENGLQTVIGLFQSQRFGAAGIVDLEVIQLVSDPDVGNAFLLGAAQYYNGQSYYCSVQIFQFDGALFMDARQVIPTNGVTALQSASYNGFDYLFVALDFENSYMMKWSPGYYIGATWTEGSYVLLASFQTSGASSVKQFSVKNQWFVGFSNYRNPNYKCTDPDHCNDEKFSLVSTVDIFTVGPQATISDFIPYPCSLLTHSCSAAQWCLSQKYAKIDLSNLSEPAVEYLKPGILFSINNEIMMVVDEFVADSQLASLDSPDTLTAFKFMDHNSDGVLDLMNETTPFAVPADYRKAWAQLPSDKARVLTFFSILQSIDSKDYFVSSAPAGLDINLDGILDLVVGFADGTLKLYPGLSNGYWRNWDSSDGPDPFIAIQSSHGYCSPTFGDLNGDGVADLVLGSAEGSLRFFIQSSTSNLAKGVKCPYNSSRILFCELKGIEYPLQQPRSIGNFSKPASIGNFSKPALEDLNGDGLVDLTLGSADGKLEVFENIGNRTWPLFRAASWTYFSDIDVGAHSAPSFFDVNGDGQKDLILGCLAGNLSVYLRSNSTSRGVFFKSQSGASPLAVDVVGEQSSPFVVHLSLNNALLAVGSSLGRVDLFEFSSGSSRSCNVCNFRYFGNLLPLRPNSANNISIQEYFRVFTGFRCMIPQCIPEDSSRRWQPSSTVDPCNRINIDYSMLPPVITVAGRTEVCEEYFLNTNDSWCNTTFTRQGYIPGHRGGKITVMRGQLNSKVFNAGTCIQSASSAGLVAVACNGKSNCVCSDGSRNLLPCSVDADCPGQTAGSVLQVLPEYANDFAQSSGMAPWISVPSIGAKDFDVFSVKNEDYLVVANYWSGCPRGYEQDSFIYRVFYNTRNFSLQQRFRTFGAHDVSVVFRSVNVSEPNITSTKIYLLVANYRSNYDLQANSQVYEWVQMADTCSAEESCLETQSGFTLSVSILTQGAVRWLQYTLPGAPASQAYIVPLSSRSVLDFSVPSSTYMLMVGNLSPIPQIRSAQVWCILELFLSTT